MSGHIEEYSSDFYEGSTEYFLTFPEYMKKTLMWGRGHPLWYTYINIKTNSVFPSECDGNRLLARQSLPPTTSLVFTRHLYKHLTSVASLSMNPDHSVTNTSIAVVGWLIDILDCLVNGPAARDHCTLACLLWINWYLWGLWWINDMMIDRGMLFENRATAFDESVVRHCYCLTFTPHIYQHHKTTGITDNTINSTRLMVVQPGWSRWHVNDIIFENKCERK